MAKDKSFWLTRPGILAGIAALITAGGGLVGTLAAVGVFPDGNDTATPTPPVFTPPDLPPFSFVAVADASVNIDKPSENLGRETTLKVDGDPMRITFVRFNVEGLTRPVTSAQLWFVCVSELKGGAPEGGSVWTTSGSWTESEITWDNHPPLEKEVVSVTTAVDCPDDRIVTYNVTDFVTGDDTYNFALKMESESVDGLTFYSRENPPEPRLHPVLVVNPPGPSQ